MDLLAHFYYWFFSEGYEKMDKERNYWPHAIVGSILAGVAACVWTVQIALSNPAEMDTFYMEKHQKVDENINNILELQKKFDANFIVDYSKETLLVGKENNLVFTLKTQQGEFVKDANIVVMLSRPETNKYNQQLVFSKNEDGKYIFAPFKVEKPGRWKVLTKIKVGEFVGYKEYELLATP